MIVTSFQETFNCILPIHCLYRWAIYSIQTACNRKTLSPDGNDLWDFPSKAYKFERVYECNHLLMVTYFKRDGVKPSPTKDKFMVCVWHLACGEHVGYCFASHVGSNNDVFLFAAVTGCDCLCRGHSDWLGAAHKIFWRSMALVLLWRVQRLQQNKIITETEMNPWRRVWDMKARFRSVVTSTKNKP